MANAVVPWPHFCNRRPRLLRQTIPAPCGRAFLQLKPWCSVASFRRTRQIEWSRPIAGPRATGGSLTVCTSGQLQPCQQPANIGAALVAPRPPPCPVEALPNWSRMPRASCLTALHEAQQLQARQPRLQVTDMVQIMLEEMPRDEKKLPKAMDDHHWAAKKQKQRSYLLYLQQLQTKLRDGFAREKEHEAQLVYQVGLTEQWLQLKHLMEIFAPHLSAAVLGAICRRLPEVAPHKTRTFFSSSEAREFSQFLSTLFATCRSVSSRMPLSHAASALYAMAMLDAADPVLCSALVGSIAPQLHTAVPANLAQISWSLGRMGHNPGGEWLERMCDACECSLVKFQPNQLWGILLGLACLGFVPRSSWMSIHLGCVLSQLKDFNAEGLGNLLQALSLMRYQPGKMWLRSCVGMCNHKIKSFLATQLTQLMEALAKLCYLPRPEVQRGILGQTRRQFHTFLPSQLATLLSSVASIPSWRPYRQFLYDFVAHSREKLAGWNVEQSCSVVWAFARVDVVPEDEYAITLLLQVQRQIGTAQPGDLARCMWALGRFRRRPNPEWLAAWFGRVKDTVDAFDPKHTSCCLWAFAALQLQPEQELLEELLRQVLLRLQESSSGDVAQLLMALADLRFQPPEAWMEAVAAEVAVRMPAIESSEYGGILYGLAVLGCPLDFEWLSQLEREAYRKLRDMDGASLVRLLWGMAQFGFSPQGEKWWPLCYRQVSACVDELSSRSLALLVVALGELIQTAPPVELQLQLIKAIRARFPKPSSNAEVAAALQRAAMLPAEGDSLPTSLWLQRFIMELRRRWGLPRPT